MTIIVRDPVSGVYTGSVGSRYFAVYKDAKGWSVFPTDGIASAWDPRPSQAPAYSAKRLRDVRRWLAESF